MSAAAQDAVTGGLRRLGQSRLWVSPICLGGMSLGNPAKGEHRWILDRGASVALVVEALSRGITFLDTAGVYAEGESERAIGLALQQAGSMPGVVVSTKVSPTRASGVGHRLNRAGILQSVSESLDRLRRDHIDLLQLHRPDPDTPLAETLDGMQAAIDEGLVTEVACSTMPPALFRAALDHQRRAGLRPFVTMHDELNLLRRECAGGAAQDCARAGIDLVPYSPLARGLLLRRIGVSQRSRSDRQIATLPAGTLARYEALASALEDVARARGVPPAEIALAWVLGCSGVKSVTVGARTSAHLDSALAACRICLEPAELARLDAPN